MSAPNHKWEAVYQVPPWDWDFPSIAVFEFEPGEGEGGPYMSPSDQQELLNSAKAYFVVLTHWEGDVVQEHVGVLPSGDCSPHYYVVVKQSNNGNCYIASDVELPWIDDEYKVPMP